MWDVGSYTIAALVFPRLLGGIYFFAIGAFLFQIRGLLGKNGILPIQDYLDSFRFASWQRRVFYIPTLFWLCASDVAIMGLVILGTLVSCILMLGVYPALCLATLFIIYLSIVSVGQDFLSFGWESFLLEITFYTFFLTVSPVPNTAIWLCLNFLLFRFYIQTGAVKLQSGDSSWRDGTAVWFHYQSQPLPNTWAWYIYQWPMQFHKISTLFVFIVELVLPFGLFFTDEVRAIVGVLFIGLQVLIWITGNLSFLNHMTVAFSVIAFSNTYLFFLSAPPEAQTPFWLDSCLFALGTTFLFLQILCLWNHFQPYRFIGEWLMWLSPFHLVNRYGLFAIMTKQRIEIVVEGSSDGEHWKEYLFSYKPSEVSRRPRRISPYQPRLDWQMWFLPFVSFASEKWFQQFLYHLLKGTPEVLALLRENPFPETPPKYVRALMYDYQFTNKKEKKECGAWWKREFVGLYSPQSLTLESDSE